MVLRLGTTPEAPVRIDAELEGASGARTLRIAAGGKIRTYTLADGSQEAHAAVQAAWAAEFDARPPPNRGGLRPAGGDPGFRPLLTENLSPDILYGYGDPCVLKAPDGWWLFATSNDAPQSFPILHSPDLERWEPRGFMFALGGKPGWTLDGPGSDFWAPEVHRTDDGYLACFAARAKDGELAIGLARAATPGGPWAAEPEPLLAGGVIDPHLVVAPDGRVLFLWKEDSNDLWPGLLAALLREEGRLIGELFPDEADQVTACLAQALWPWIETLAPMERFAALQPFIAAVTDEFSARHAHVERLESHPELGARAAAIRQAMRTRIFAQELSDGRLVGEPRLVLQNDQAWEAHLIEGMWVTQAAGRWWMFYSGNDFSTLRYGIGVAVADDPLGPWTKAAAPFLASSPTWWSPGHPSVAEGPDGRPWLFLHAFRPGELGYKVFRALVALPLRFGPDGVTTGDAATAAGM